MKELMARARALITARPWVSAAVVVVVVGGSVTGYLLTNDSTSAAAQTGVTTRLVAASTGTVQQSVSTTGTLAPADEQDVSFSSAAEVTSVSVATGDKVTKGQVLGTIDPLALKSTLAQARATLATAQATLASAQDSGTATDDQLSADEASVSTARSAVTAANTDLAGATLRSPIAGTVAEVNVAKGDKSSGTSSGGSATGSGAGSGAGSGSGSGSGGGTGSGSGQGSSGQGSSGQSGSGTGSSSSSADFVVIGMKKWTVTASVDDTEVGLISKGDQAQISTDNVAGRVFGTVSSVSVLSSSSSGSASYPVTIAVTGSPAGLHDGASATVAIIYKQVSNVLTVPTTAVHTSGGASYVYVSSGGKKIKKTVTTGLASGGSTQITSGLASGQQVYVQTVRPAGRTGTTTRQGTGRTGTGGGGFGGYPGGGFPGGGQGGGQGQVTR